MIPGASLCLALLLLGVQAPVSEPSSVPEGLRLLSELSLDAAADLPLFQRVGFDRAAALLSAVMQHGQRAGASRDDWASMHRAVDGLVALYVAKGEPLRAAVFAGIQAQLYQTYDEDGEEAIAAAQRALEIKRVSGDGSVFIEQAALGHALLFAGRPADALPPLRLARDGHPEPASNHAAIQWRSIVRAELARGRVVEAQREAEAFERAAAAPAAPGRFRVHAALASAEIDVASGRFDAALDRLRSARDIAAGDAARETLEFEIAANLAAMILDATRAVAYEQAIGLADRIDREFRGLAIELAPFARAVVRSRRRAAGHFDDVLREEGAELARARATGNAWAQVLALRAMAATYASLNALTQAGDLLEEALGLARDQIAKQGASGSRAEAREFFSLLVAVGDAQLAGGRHAEAGALYGEVITEFERYESAAVRKELAPWLGRALLGRAALAERKGDLVAAQTPLIDALAGKPSDATFDRTDVLNRLARLVIPADPARAAEYYRQVIQLHAAARDRFAELGAQLRLAEFLATTPGAGAGRFDEARRLLETAARDASLLRYSDAAWRVSYVRGLLAQAEGRDPQAIEAFTAAIERLEMIRAGLGAAEQRAAFLDSDATQRVYRSLVGLLMAAGRTNEAWHTLERAKARTFLESLHGRRFAPASASPVVAELTALEEQIVALRVTLSPELQAVHRGAGREPQVVLRDLRELERRFARAREQSALTAVRAAHPLAAEPISLAEVQRRLAPGTALVEYALLDGQIAAFVVTRAGSRQAVWRVDTTALRDNAIKVRDLMADLMAPGNLPALAADVSTALLSKVLELVPDGTEHLVIVPADFMAYLPFEALAMPDGRQLIDRFAISYLPSASTLQFLERPARTAPGTLFLGALGNSSIEDWPPLPGTLVETDAILRQFPSAQRAAEGQLTRSRTLEALTSFDTVHFATHGLLDEHAPIFSALLMGTTQDGTRVSLYEITEIPVKAGLVVLSACETGRGRMLRGDEIVGLTRTFLQAGADTVVSSLWKVADDSTAFLMQRFYAGLGGGLPPSRAMREAILAARKEFGHPFFWAPFIVTGAK